MTQSRDDLEAGYKTPDPWGYKKSPVDWQRRDHILKALDPFIPPPQNVQNLARFSKALDIACGEGWISQYLPAFLIDGIEISDTAASRFPPNVNRVHYPDLLKYDLVVATGCLYDHYDVDTLIDWINIAAKDVILICNIADWESPKIRRIIGKEVHAMQFAYMRPEAEYVQQLRVFKR